MHSHEDEDLEEAVEETTHTTRKTDKKNTSDDIYNETLFEETQNIDSFARKISTKEEELLKKARDLENEMKAVKQAKVDIVVK